ncbi:MAG: glucose-6-phosphate isomerase [Magnetovibrio sp.]|nr:glucose-6-phosphate isomerase [Magnetovibrio sp.]
MKTASLRNSSAWQALAAHQRTIAGSRMRDLFAADASRFNKFSLTLDGLLLDYSKNRISGETMRLLCDLARQAGLEKWRDRMFSGQTINTTEGRAVLHVALRNRSGRAIEVDGEDVMPKVEAALRRMLAFAEAVRDGSRAGATGKPITDVVNIGIGGSHLGPAMVCRALKPFQRADLRLHFVANVDASQISEALNGLDPASTLFIVASKTFTTEETMTNAVTAKSWLIEALGGQAVGRHFVALSSNAEATAAFGIEPASLFEFWDWVGGRFSLWSAIGLAIAIAIGAERFEELLSGAHAMDEHFRAAPLAENLPVILGLLGVWYVNFLAAESHAVIPYDQRLELLPAYLQQVEMESNGKGVTRGGEAVDCATAPIVFGEAGTIGQHSFFQLLHQGTRLVPADFIAAAESHHSLGDHHAILLANFFAQTEALMKGRSEAETRAELEAAGLTGEALEGLLPHKLFAGNRPTNSILLRRLDPRALGMLIALYEHKVFVQGVIWEIDSFDQWGVELGKRLAKTVLRELQSDRPVDGHDSSTSGLINEYKRLTAVKS